MGLDLEHPDPRDALDEDVHAGGRLAQPPASTDHAFAHVELVIVRFAPPPLIETAEYAASPAEPVLVGVPPLTQAGHAPDTLGRPVAEPNLDLVTPELEVRVDDLLWHEHRQLDARGDDLPLGTLRPPPGQHLPAEPLGDRVTDLAVRGGDPERVELVRVHDRVTLAVEDRASRAVLLDDLVPQADRSGTQQPPLQVDDRHLVTPSWSSSSVAFTSPDP